MVVQRPSSQASGTSGDCDVFLVPKAMSKKATKTPDANQWFHVQKRLLSTTRAEKLWRYYKELKINNWDQCGLCIQIGKMLSKRMGKRWLLRQAEQDWISMD